MVYQLGELQQAGRCAEVARVEHEMGRARRGGCCTRYYDRVRHLAAINRAKLLGWLVSSLRKAAERAEKSKMNVKIS